MSSSVTTAMSSSAESFISFSSWAFRCIARIWVCSSSSLSRSSAESSKFLFRTASSFSLVTLRSSCSISLASGGSLERRSLTRDPASSIRSMALSGRYRSLMYWLESFVAASRASSEILSLWCCSYLSRRPYRICRLSSSVGSPTVTGWNRRSRALSFSMCFRYSSMVVAPMHCISPRARAGFRMLAASMAPSAAPAPTRVWISSITTMTSPADLISSMIFFNRSSNSPRYRVPATKSPISSEMTRLDKRVSGTSEERMR
mmetsp:Transcript_26514/g.45674  ORF Transcript_26514/g.45674 Transcript_26514/m.45674 type:complete len:260 (-) Transcript_26514:1162-1941(-)